MEATVFTSLYVSNLPKPKAVFNLSPPALSLSSCWLCNSHSKRITKLRLNGSNNGILRLHALFHNEETPCERDDNLAENSGFSLLPADIFSLSQEKVESSQSGEKDSHKIIDVETSLALPPQGGGNRAGLFRTPISGGVQNATSAHGLPPPALAVRNLMEQARFAHLCTVMSNMHHRREGYPFGSLVDFAPDPMGHQNLSMAFNKYLKLKAPMVEDYGSSLEEAFNKGVEATTEHYRAKLFIYKQLNDAIAKKHVEEREVSRIQGKLELMYELFKKNPFSKEKEKQLEFELVRAEAKAADVELPYIDWYKLNEPQMFD